MSGPLDGGGVPFPEFIRALPMVDSPLESLQGWMLQTGQGLAMFYEIPDGVEVPEHAHGAQWGVVLEGTMEFTIGGETRVYGRGDTYYVPAGVTHRAAISPGYVGIDVFADADRYRAREG
jgi:quercetin dioxygenase-like cupin family protein